MQFYIISLLSLSALALALAAPQANVAPTCGSDGDCTSFCSGGPCTKPFCGLSAFGDDRCFCGGC
ncbi:hypothetical protein BDP81DRAFT_410695 [Colletotrichum phormii]|uniref:Uncharacterized protein n=1 Tax=Colletotrichum phormii TaxID=359342 RepID=A0AAI9ZF77_9PEZI|nr:uncharacterized protein BDP81DRAFT_410695 [Colletotrichum phormii]KAK1623457.1 hypothetical protein BDP81DRAFT_410695 [Colletotrichum phormii]